MSIFKLLHRYQDLLSLNKHFQITATEIQAVKNDSCYLKINDHEITLFGVDMFSRLKNNNKDNRNNFDSYFLFINKIKNNIIRINHLGFGYQTDNLDNELRNFNNHLLNDFELVEERSGDEKNNRWFFIKHKTDQSVPKIELIFYLTDKYRGYCPQFQLDIDTDLSYEAIQTITDKLFGTNFFFWKYDILKYGTVMAMGKIGQIHGVNILAGIGTNLRKQQSFKTIQSDFEP